MDLDQQADNLAANGPADNCVPFFIMSKKNRVRGLEQRDGEEKDGGDPNQGDKMGDWNKMEQAADVRRDGGFDWPGFFRNPRVMLQIILYLLLLYTIVPRPLMMGPLSVCLLLVLPLFVLNLMGTHVLTELAAKREKQLARTRRDGPAEDDSDGHLTG